MFFYAVRHSGDGFILVFEGSSLLFGDGSYKLNFYFLILFVIEKGEVKGLVGGVNVLIDESDIPDELDEKEFFF